MDRNRDRSYRDGGASLRGAAWLAVLALAGCGSATSGATATGTSGEQPVAASLVFDGVTVVDVEQGRLVAGQRVVVAGNRIIAVGSRGAVRMPKGAQVVDATGKYLIPGLWDLHTHSRRYTNLFYPLLLANGVTGIRDAASEVPLDTLIGWRREILAGTRVGPPRQVLSGQSIDETKGSCTRRKALHTCVVDTADARHLIDSLKAAGADMIKMYQLSQAMYFAIAAQARRTGIPFGGHLQGQQLTVTDVSDSGAALIDHPNTSGGLGKRCFGKSANVEDCRPVAEQLARNGTWFVPTLVRMGSAGQASVPIYKRLFALAPAFWSDSVLNQYSLNESGSANTSATPVSAPVVDSLGYMSVAQRAGVPILAGTDAGAPVLTKILPGFALHAELAMYVAEGLTPAAALRTATLNPAKWLRGTDSLGTVAPGKLADLVLLDADPLANISNTTAIRGVVANGRYFDRIALDSVLSGAQAEGKREPRPLGTARAGD